MRVVNLFANRDPFLKGPSSVAALWPGGLTNVAVDSGLHQGSRGNERFIAVGAEPDYVVNVYEGERLVRSIRRAHELEPATGFRSRDLHQPSRSLAAGQRLSLAGNSKLAGYRSAVLL